MFDQPQKQPHSIEAEIAVLGSFLIAADAVPRAVEIVRECDFYRESHRRLFMAALALFQRGDTVDVITISEYLKSTGEMDSVGGYEYIASLIDAVPTAANLEYHARIVREKATLRRLIEHAGIVIREAYSTNGDGIGSVMGAVDKLGTVLGDQLSGGFTWIKHTLWSTFERIEKMQQAGGGVHGVPSGFHDLDRKTGGFQGGNLIVVAARPSMGKTAWALDVVREAAIGHSVVSGVVSLEMSTSELTMRMLCQEGRVDMQEMRSGRMSQEAHQRLAAAAGHLNTAPIHIDDHPSGSISEVVAKVTRLHQRDGLGLAVIDYLQLMKAPGESRRHEIDAITRSLKELAVRLDIPIILLSQLSRAPEARTNHRPILSDLRESGGIEQDADLVLFIYRPEMYVQDDDGPAKQTEADSARRALEGKAELILAKQRNGPTGVIPLYFNKAFTRFDSVQHGGPTP